MIFLVKKNEQIYIYIHITCKYINIWIHLRWQRLKNSRSHRRHVRVIYGTRRIRDTCVASESLLLNTSVNAGSTTSTYFCTRSRKGRESIPVPRHYTNKSPVT